MADFAELRARMVIDQIVARGVRDPLVLAAMREVPRERFVPKSLINLAYNDGPLEVMSGQTISQPYIVALMVAALQLQGGERVLDVGTGSGYAAAVLGHIAGEIYTVERLPELVAYARGRFRQLGYTNIHTHEDDGTLGWPEQAPYDAIIVGAAGPRVPKALRQQLAVGGRLVMPLGPLDGIQELVRETRLGAERFRREQLTAVRFVPLIGAQGWSDSSE